MTAAATPTNWTEEFGLDARQPPNLFTSKSQISPSTPQAHLLRRAFDVLKVDGILCVDHSPLAYFKLVKRVTPAAVYEMHRQFWNHSGASLLVLVTDDRVQVYSGMTRPTPVGDMPAELPSLVKSIERVADALKEFVIAVESGEFFHKYQRSFDPAQRVDRDLLDNLQNTRTKLDGATQKRIPTDVLDALLCRLVFTCYLFDRKVIGESYLQELGIRNVADLRGLLNISSRPKARESLYKLFEKLRHDFNGDLFSNDLSAEKKLIQDEHIKTLNDFFQGTNVVTGQGALFWPYDFEFIPIETISAIYERFLKSADEQKGAFYTPRFLAEVVLDTALDGIGSLIGKRFFDPACGSGIFLVGLFNRIAEEWKQSNPNARNDRRATELMQLLRESLFGVDISRTACRITAFSLYLAYLDQLSPPDIQALQKKGKALPQLVATDDKSSPAAHGGNIVCADFFTDTAHCPADISLVIGNPPWGSIATKDTPAGKWCDSHSRPIPDKQIAAAFAWKAAGHITAAGKVCLLLPHGILFNHGTTAISFQTAWVKAHEIERVINLADLRFLLFEKAIHPAIVVSYRQYAPRNASHAIEYWTPKADWTVTQAEVITIAPQDRTFITVGELLKDLASPDAPQIWKNRHWATHRDWRLLDRLMSLPRLRDIVRQPRDAASPKRWLMAEGFQPFGKNDPEESRKQLTLPNRRFIPARSSALDLFILPDDCENLASTTIDVRRLHSSPGIFKAPHVLVAKGFTSIAFADFDVSFRHALRGISGPTSDSDLLAFLAAYLRSSLARYFLFHTSSNWGIYRPEVHVDEVLRIPFLLPDQQAHPQRSWEIVRAVAQTISESARATKAHFLDRDNQLQNATRAIEPLIHEYFDVLPMEAALINDTLNIVEPSIQPTQTRMPVETVKPASDIQCGAYLNQVRSMLNGWGKGSGSHVRGEVMRSESLGIGIVILERIDKAKQSEPMDQSGQDMIRVLDKVRKAIPKKHVTLDVVRGVMVFDKRRLFVVKPIGQRFWTQSAAMNDADEIAGTILMRTPGEYA
ncbi:MAG: N-6 DNA methylase [Planctomycetota bacterium]|nr:N-6 DNA methylase [Planctomycetota bacterium]